MHLKFLKYPKQLGEAILIPHSNIEDWAIKQFRNHDDCDEIFLFNSDRTIRMIVGENTEYTFAILLMCLIEDMTYQNN